MYNFLKSSFTRFVKNDRGNFIMVAALAAPAIVFAGGSAVDFARFLEAKEQARTALDGASLAAATGISQNEATEAEARALGEGMFLLNIPDSISPSSSQTASQNVQGGQEIQFGVSAAAISGSDDADNGTYGDKFSDFVLNFDNANNTVTAEVDVTVPTLFAHLFGIDELTTNLSSTSAFRGVPGERENIEVVFVVDVTGSMAGQRIVDLRESLEATVNILLPEDGRTIDRVRVGLVPYAASVNLGRDFYSKAVITGGSSFNGRTCALERDFSVFAFSDVAANTSQSNTLYDNPRFGRSTISCPSVAMRPLTNDREVLLDDISSLTASGTTAGHIGITWGLNMLSGEWRSFWPEEAKPAEYQPASTDEDDTEAELEEGEAKVRKILVVMTDGAFNRSYFDQTASDQIWQQVGAGNIESRSNISTSNGARSSFRSAEIFCNLAKDDERNVEVYTIAFDAGDNAENLLRDCATSDDPDSDDPIAQGPHFFEADSGEALNAAFRSIAAQQLEVLLTN